jgi:signal recognition particle GTPase
MSDQSNVWDRARLQERKAKLEEGLKSLEEQFKMAFYSQRGAISDIDEMLAELDEPDEQKEMAANGHKGSKRDVQSVTGEAGETVEVLHGRRRERIADTGD